MSAVLSGGNVINERLSVRNRYPWRWLVYLIIPLPAIAVGAAIMRRDAPHLALAHVAEAMALYALLLSWIVVGGRRQSRQFYVAYSVVGVLLLLGTFGDAGMENVHRWIQFGGFRLNIGEAFLPALVVVISSPGRVSRMVLLFVFAILLAQPDAGRVTALAAAGWTVFSFKRPRSIALGFSVALLFLICLGWTRSDPLGRVSYVEDIVALAFAKSWLCGVGSILSLLLLPLPFVIDYRVNRTVRSLALAAYFTVSIIVPFIGNLPVPVLGYGAAGLIGYFVGLSSLFWGNEERGAMSECGAQGIRSADFGVRSRAGKRGNVD